eukprot:m.190430 g.190430  ORF g.190430 m.190430 type:complete len:80 (+) comp15129_c0_seq2:89-328(+)
MQTARFSLFHTRKQAPQGCKGMAGVEEMVVVPAEVHDRIFSEAFKARGFDPEETAAAVHMASLATRHGVRSDCGIPKST